MIHPINEMLLTTSIWLDNSYPENISEEAADWRRLMKLAEEVGEVRDAYAGMLGENPRKGVTHSRYHVEEELLDVMLTAGAALMHMKKNNPDFDLMLAFDFHLRKKLKRVGLPYAKNIATYNSEVEIEIQK